MKKYNVALIGNGKWGKKVYKNLKNSKNLIIYGAGNIGSWVSSIIKDWDGYFFDDDKSDGDCGGNSAEDSGENTYIITNCLINLFDKIDPSIILDIFTFHQNDFDKTVAALVEINNDINPDENDRLFAMLLQNE